MSYTRFLLVVLSAYKQLHQQQKDVLCDVKSGDFKAAFDILLPVIQGLGDVDASHSQEVTEDLLQKTMDFVATVLTTSTSEVASAKESGYLPTELFERDGAVLGPDQIAKLVSQTGANVTAEKALRSINARKPLQLYDPRANFEQEEVNGIVADLQKGSVGLRIVDPAAAQ